MAFDLAKCNWPVQRFDRGKINSGPVAFLCGRISVCGSNYFRDPHDRFVVAAMIEKNFIAVLHSTKIVSGRVITYAGPTGLAFRDKVRPRIRAWFLFHEPEIFHAVEYCSHHRRHSERSRGIPWHYPGFSMGFLDFAVLRTR